MACPGCAVETQREGTSFCELSQAAMFLIDKTAAVKTAGLEIVRQTALCGVGYDGFTCSECAEGYYAVGDNICASCGAEDGDSAELIALVLCSLVLVVFEALSIVLMKEERLYLFISSIIGLQQVRNL